MNSLDRKLLRDLWHLKSQAIAIALIVACGIASFLSVLTAYQSLQLSQTIYYEQYRFAQVFASLKRAPESIADQIRQLPGVAQVQTRIVVDVTLDVPDQPEPVVGRLVSIPEQPLPILNDLYLRQGRYLQPGHRDEVLVSEAFAKAHQLQVEDTIGAVINGRWQRLRIVGIALSPEYVYEIRGGDLFPDNQRFGVMWMARKALGTAFNLDGAFNDVALSLLPHTNPAEVIFRLDQLLERYGGLGAYDREDQISNRFLSDEIKQLRSTATFVPTVFLAIAAFLLHVVLSRLISTQRDQIAVLKAFGYDSWAIGGHFLKFVLAIVLLGAALGTAIGLGLGAALTENYARFFQFPVLRYEANLSMVLAAIGISCGAAIFGGWQAVQQAIALPPAEAMRPESPAHFRPTLLESWGFQRFLSPVGRMILRNLERKPIQSLFSIVGIAAAIAILVLGFYFIDAMQYMIDVQFRKIQRDDVTLLFNEPRPSRACYDLEHLPGVLLVEPFRVVLSRLRFEHRTYRIAIMGLPRQSQLRQLLDRRLQPTVLPPEGLLLSRKLAQILGVEPGDALTIEILEGSRPVRSIVLGGVVDELVGVSAYMNRSALNQLMQEGSTISGAFLAVDTDQLDALYPVLKRMPAIASVSLRKTMIQRFQQTIAESISISTTTLLIFAGVIACGVVYNSARIALSERGRELATLRILGFSKRQVAIILLGEQAMLTIAAMPLGLGIGLGLAAWMSVAFESELYRIPLYITRATYTISLLVVAIAAIGSGAIVRRQLDRIDLVAVLKTRE